MIIHFETQNAAINHLRKSDFRRLGNGSWISPSREVSASIHPRAGSEVVAIFFVEV